MAGVKFSDRKLKGVLGGGAEHNLGYTPEETEGNRDNKRMRAESQGTSATLSSNTHSGWASSYYSPPGAQAAPAPHSGNQPTPSRHHHHHLPCGSCITASKMLQKHREGGGSLRQVTAASLSPTYEGKAVSRFCPITSLLQQARHWFSSRDLSGWLAMRKHVPHGR